jgi:hypothetical protein
LCPKCAKIYLHAYVILKFLPGVKLLDPVDKRKELRGDKGGVVMGKGDGRAGEGREEKDKGKEWKRREERGWMSPNNLPKSAGPPQLSGA